jgi:hypothetical protein
MKRPAPPPERRLKSTRPEPSAEDIAKRKAAKQANFRREMVELESKRAAAETLGYADMVAKYAAAMERVQAEINALDPIEPE